MLGAVSSHLLFLFLVNWSSFFLDLCGSSRPDSIFYSDLISIGGGHGRLCVPGHRDGSGAGMGSEPRLSDATLTLLELLEGGRSFFSGMLHTKDHTSLICRHVEKMGLEIKAIQRKKTGKSG